MPTIGAGKKVSAIPDYLRRSRKCPLRLGRERRFNLCLVGHKNYVSFRYGDCVPSRIQKKPFAVSGALVFCRLEMVVICYFGCGKPFAVTNATALCRSDMARSAFSGISAA